MSTLRISNIEAKADSSSPTVDEQLKFTNSDGDLMLYLDGRTAGITTVGINTTNQTIKFDANNNVMVTGIITATEFHGALAVGTSVTYGDNEKAYFGTGLDMSIYHDGTNSNITNAINDLNITNTGDDIVITANDDINLKTNAGDNAVNILGGAAVELYHNASKKLETTSSGIKVAGDIRVGNGSALSIKNDNASETLAAFNNNGAVELYFNNVRKAHTSTQGMRVVNTGADAEFRVLAPSGYNAIVDLTADASAGNEDNYRIEVGTDQIFKIKGKPSGTYTSYFEVHQDGKIRLPVDNQKLQIGAGQDLELFHDGSHNYILGATGDIILKNSSVNYFKGVTSTGAVELYHNNNLRVQTDTSSTIFRGSAGIRVYGDAGQNQNGQISLHPVGSAVYTNLFFYNAAGSSYASIVGHAGGTLFFDAGSNSPLRHRVSGSGFHSFQEGNTERVRIAANGAIGLGGANYGTSGQVLTSGGSGSAVTWSTISGTTINNNADNRIITGSGTANTLNGESSVVIDSNSNIIVGGTGVGNASTYARDIVVTGSSNNGMTIHTSDTSGSNRKCCIFFGTGTSVADMADGMLFYDHAGQYFHMSTAGAGTGVTKSSIRLHSDGTVRFDSTPTATNSISLTLKSHKARAVNDNNGILFRDANDHSQAAMYVQKKSTSNGTSDLVFSVSSGQVVNSLQGIPEKLRLTSAGILEGNGMFIFGNPGNFGGVSSTQGCRIVGQQGSHPACLSLDGGGSPTLELGSKSGEVLIGSNSNAGSPINFKTQMGIGTLSGGTTRFQINSNGNIGAPTGNNIYNASDERLKENMVELTDGLSKIQKLKPISFTWKEGWDVNLDGKKEYGFGAQTTEAVDEMLVEPFSLVDAELNGEIIEKPLRVNEKYIIPLLVKAIQELSAKVTALGG